MKGVTALAFLAIAAAAFSACGERSSQQPTPQNRLIALDDSIAGIRLDEPRKSVEKTLGRGSSKRPGLVSYFGGHLLIDYVFHDQLTTRVEGLETRWSGFHTRAGVHVGSRRQDLRALRVTCSDGICGRAAGTMPDGPGTGFTMRRGQVIQIDVSYG